jgi:hypothetical protein
VRARVNVTTRGREGEGEGACEEGACEGACEGELAAEGARVRASS